MRTWRTRPRVVGRTIQVCRCDSILTSLQIILLRNRQARRVMMALCEYDDGQRCCRQLAPREDKVYVQSLVLNCLAPSMLPTKELRCLRKRIMSMHKIDYSLTLVVYISCIRPLVNDQKNTSVRYTPRHVKKSSSTAR